jgi:hypothetical protein
LIESLKVEEQVVVVQQSSAPQQTSQRLAAPVEATPPGAPPVILASVIREHWLKTQQVARRLNSNLPALMDYAQARHVDGNRVVIAVTNDIFREKLETPDKREALEKALRDVHKIALKVQVVLVDSLEQPQEDSAMDLNDPLVSLGLELGAEIHSQDDE